MAEPFEALFIDIKLCAKGALVEVLFGALINYSTFVAAEGIALRFIFEKILSDFRANILQQKT